MLGSFRALSTVVSTGEFLGHQYNVHLQIVAQVQLQLWHEAAHPVGPPWDETHPLHLLGM